MEYNVEIRVSEEKLDEALAFCKDRFGHRGIASGWWWNVKGKWNEHTFVFSFEKEEDALMFKISKGYS